jgi:glucose/arabinose dehydrogenase
MSLRFLILILLGLSVAACGGGDGDANHPHDPGGDDDDIVDENGLIRLERVLPGLGFTQPLLFLQHPDLDNIFYVLQQNGVIWRTDVAAGNRTELVDLRDHYDVSTCGECGLLGMAFHPDFIANGFIYLSFMEGPDNDLTSYVARFHSTDGGETLEGTPDLVRLDILSVEQPFTNHNGGHIAFGQDGFLYAGLGDGGSANDPEGNGQDLNTVLGKMLRLVADGTGDDGNAAPDNILAGGADDRIYAYGLRNPWRWSFDSLTGELWLGDVGQNAYEEVNIIENGGNYGWRCREGFQPTPGINCSPNSAATDPVAVYGHNLGSSITGGYVYRGTDLGEDYQGAYIFGDYISGRIWGLFPQGPEYDRDELLDSSINISSFGEDRNGELYVIDHGGRIYRIFGNED